LVTHDFTQDSHALATLAPDSRNQFADGFVALLVRKPYAGFYVKITYFHDVGSFL
jgi:hypothetical protein